MEFKMNLQQEELDLVNKKSTIDFKFTLLLIKLKY